MESKINIVAKSAVSREQLEHRLMLGSDAIEIQLLKELNDDNGLPTKDWHEHIDVNMLVNYPVVALHVPISKDMIMLEHLHNVEYRTAFKNICSLANFIGSVRETVITVVIHSEMCYDKMSKIGLLNDLTYILDDLLSVHTWVRVAVENVIPVNYDGVDIILRNNYKFDNVMMVKYLRSFMQYGDRLGTLLDIAHAIGSKRVHNTISDVLKLDVDKLGYELSEYYRANKDYRFGIHLADMTGFGIKSKNHGTKLNCGKESGPAIEPLVLYDKYEYSCYICPEIKEKDYNNCVNLKAAIEIIRDYEKLKTSEK